MNLLIVNFEMDDHGGVLAWQASVARALARSCASVLVLTERVGTFAPAPNLEVRALEYRPLGVPHRLGGAVLMRWSIYRLLKERRIDRCFIHMNHPWAYRLAPILRALRIPSLLWYAHGTVTPSLHRALRAATRVITSTPEGFRIPSSKVRVIGQGVNTDLFRIPAFTSERRDILYVGRISRRKRIELLLSAMAAVTEVSPQSGLRLRLVGPNLTPDDLQYDMEMRTRMWAMGLQDRVDFVGFVPQERIPGLYASAFLHLNVSHTGSMDKTVVEALACGCPVLTSNEAFAGLLSDHPDFVMASERPADIARQILRIRDELGRHDPHELRRLVVGRHDQDAYVGKVLAQLEEIG
jgi:glycosyltransferase involved in cell wall biosynthesis